MTNANSISVLSKVVKVW